MKPRRLIIENHRVDQRDDEEPATRRTSSRRPSKDWLSEISKLKIFLKVIIFQALCNSSLTQNFIICSKEKVPGDQGGSCLHL